MKNSVIISTFVLAAICLSSCGSQKTIAVTSVPTDECAVLGFQCGNNVSADEAKEIREIFLVNFHPSKYKMTETERIDNALLDSGYQLAKMTKQQACEVGRRLGVKIVVMGSINKLMDEYSVDVLAIDSVKETTMAFDGKAFPKSESGKEINVMARTIASKIE